MNSQTPFDESNSLSGTSPLDVGDPEMDSTNPTTGRHSAIRPSRHRDAWTRAEWIAIIATAVAGLAIVGLVVFAVIARQVSNDNGRKIDAQQQQINGLQAKANAAVGAATSANASLSAAGLPTVSVPTSAAAPTATVTITGAEGPSGLNGKGIVSSSLSDGHLLLSYTDGSTTDVGMVVGPEGSTGPSGANGANGADGRNGSDGRGITSTVITPDGHLVITYSDGSTADLGVVVGSNGQQGNPGTGVGGFTFTVPGLVGSTTYSCTPDNSDQNAHYSCVATNN